MKDELTTLTPDQLTRVSGGFLPLLGLLGSVASIGGQVTGMIGQSKAKKAQKITADAQAEAQAAGLNTGGDPSQQQGGGVNPTAGMMPQAAPSSGG
jgi:hypothetical protein